MKNPFSTRTSTPFTNVRIISEDLAEGNIYEIAQFSRFTVPGITNKLPANILDYLLHQDNKYSAEKTNYKIRFVPTNLIPETGSILMTYPS